MVVVLAVVVVLAILQVIGVDKIREKYKFKTD